MSLFIITFRLSVLATTLMLTSSLLNAGNLKVMTFNIRQDTASDKGDRDWDKRKQLVFHTINKASIVGIQEARHNQIQDIAKAQPKFHWIGKGRDDGKKHGEFCPIFYDKSLFQVKDSGTFWLSDTPDKPGSKHWGNNYPRVCTWARLLAKNGAGLYVFNTHLDHSSQPSREKSVEFILEKIKLRKYIDEPAILLGDFNATIQNNVIKKIAHHKDFRKKTLIDSYLATDPKNRDPSTFNLWNPKHQAVGKIDYIFHSHQLKPESSEILKPSKGSMVASDHWPQLTTFQWYHSQQNRLIDWQYFKETVLDKEFGDGKGFVIRWDIKTINLRIIGANTTQLKLIQKATSEINDALKGTGFSLKTTDQINENEIRCHIGTFEKLKKACEKESLSPPRNYAGFALLRWVTKTKKITSATALIAIDRIDSKDLYHVILEEITQALGLPGDNTVYPESITFSRNKDHGSAPHLSNVDKKAIQLIYRHLKPGDNLSKVKQAFDRHWGE